MVRTCRVLISKTFSWSTNNIISLGVFEHPQQPIPHHNNKVQNPSQNLPGTRTEPHPPTHTQHEQLSDHNHFVTNTELTDATMSSN